MFACTKYIWANHKLLGKGSGFFLISEQTKDVGFYFDGQDKVYVCTFLYLAGHFFAKEYLSDIQQIFDLDRDLYLCICKNIDNVYNKKLFKENIFYIPYDMFSKFFEPHILIVNETLDLDV